MISKTPNSRTLFCLSEMSWSYPVASLRGSSVGETMLNIKINSYGFEFEDNIDAQKIIEEALKHPKLLHLTRVKHQDLMYFKNDKIVKYNQLVEEGLKDHDELSILMFVSGG